MSPNGLSESVMAAMFNAPMSQMEVPSRCDTRSTPTEHCDDARADGQDG
jgi:hypothetical protein